MARDSLGERDGHAISKAIRILSDAGFDVEQLGDGAPAEGGVVFELKVRGRSRYDSFWRNVEQAQAALDETPELDFQGEPVGADDG